MRSLALAFVFGVILSAEAHGQATVFQNVALREIVALPIPGRDGVISFYIYPGSPYPFGNLGAGFDVNSVCAVGPGPTQGIRRYGRVYTDGIPLPGWGSRSHGQNGTL